MSLRNILFLFSFITLIAACNSNSPENDNQTEGYVAIIDTSMTLMEVAKANRIGEPYLRTMLGIKKGIGSKYTVSEMAQRFNFEISDLRKVIEDRKNKQSGYTPDTPKENGRK